MARRFSASNAGMMMHCSASANLELAIPGWVPPVDDRTANTAANRGTHKHEILEPIKQLTATEIMRMGEYLTWLSEIRSRRRFKVLVEHEVVAEWLDDRPDGSAKPSTTADQVLYVADEIHIVDDKWGKIPVSVYDNAQLLYYAVCYAGLAPKADGVHLHIAQPMIQNYESTFVSATDLALFMDEARAADRRILAGDITFAPSDHCTFCPANPHSRGLKGSPMCPEMLRILYPGVINEDDILSL